MGLLMMSHVFKVKGIWQMNDIKLIQITWLLHVNWFLQNLFINLQFAPNNSSIIQNSKTTANKKTKKIRDLNFQSLWMFQKMIKDLSKLETLTWLKSSNASNGVSLNNKKWLVTVSHVFKNWLTRNMSFTWKIRKEIKRKQRDNLKKR